MVMVTEGRPVSAFPSCRKTDVVLYTYSWVSAITTKRKTPADRPSNKGSIIPMSRVPIAAIKYPDGLIILSRKTSKKADEADFVVELAETKQ